MKTKHLVVDGAICRCNFGVSPDLLKVLTQNKEYANDVNGQKKLIASSMDIGSPFQAGTFGACANLSGSPCKSSVILWKDYYDKTQLSNGGFPLLEDSKATCPVGGPDCISIIFHGQITAMNKPDFLKAKPLLTKILNPAANITEVMDDITYVV
ncbi:MAG: DUF4280 domain-containing protein [Candidatus Symbiothrix sp.]|jgi:hypothetical protein|nr:DUF4280 domain-containing protein [Candidatus Symbiothrix sp.]